MTKTCKICGTTDDASEFYAGVSNRCKECHKAKVRDNRAANVERYREYDAKRFQDDPRVRLRHQRYQASPAGRASMTETRRKWLELNSDKRAAHVILGNAVRRGSVHKPLSCEACGSSGVRIHGHHHDYTMPLNVKWLCPTCHRKEHA